MNKEQVIKYFGSRMAAAHALGVDNSTISRWSHVPVWHQKSIERISNGELKADEIEHKKTTEMVRVCYNLPKVTHEQFRAMCDTHDVSMSKKVSELIDHELKHD